MRAPVVIEDFATRHDADVTLLPELATLIVDIIDAFEPLLYATAQRR